MKNQKKSKRLPSWGFKGLLSVALSILTVAVFAQGAEVCQGNGYTIADAVAASAGSEYRWLENGNVLANTNQSVYNVPNNKAAGVYTYVRQSKSAGCPDWQSSNEFTVTVFDCAFAPPSTATGTTATFTDPRDGKQYKTVVMPDGRTWFAQNLNYTKDLTFNAYAREANGKQFISSDGSLAIGSYWCPGASGSTYSGGLNMCNIYGALYTWETAMMVDGKYADETKTSSAWDESWVLPYYYDSGAFGTTPNADKNNARGGSNVKGGGRGICPMGWHIPTLREWATLLDRVEGNGSGTIFSNSTTIQSWLGDDVGQKLKTSATFTDTDPLDGSWQSSNKPGTNVYNFNGIPNYGRNLWSDPHFVIGTGCVTWVNLAIADATDAVGVVYKYEIPAAGIFPFNRASGRTVRCLRD